MMNTLDIPRIFSESDLPVARHFDALFDAIQSNQQVIIQAEPGAGKTSLLPLLALHQLQSKQLSQSKRLKVILITPRRLAAKNAANRLSNLLCSPMGQGTVGFQTGIESQTSNNNQIIVMTEALLVKILQADPECADIGHIIFDEFHERSAAADLGLMLACEVQQAFNESLKISVMSASLDMQSLQQFMPLASVHPIEGRQYPVEVSYKNRPLKTPIESHLVSVLGQHLNQESRDILIFMDGRKSIEGTYHALAESSFCDEIEVLILHSSIEWKQQQQIIQGREPTTDLNHRFKQRVILATNIAETSLTIPNIGSVIDTGMMRSSLYDEKSDSTRLLTSSIAMQNAIQRTGRAGRVESGYCIRCWSADKTLAKYHRPEIMTTDLKPIVLELAQWGSCEYEQITWLTAPSKSAFRRAQQSLHRAGALHENNQISELGQSMLGLGCDLKQAKLLINSANRYFFEAACLIVFSLQERIQWNHHAALETAEDIVNSIIVPKRLQSLFQRKTKQWHNQLKAQKGSFDDLKMALIDAFIDNIGQKQSPKQFKLANGIIGYCEQANHPKINALLALDISKQERGFRINHFIKISDQDYDKACTQYQRRSTELTLSDNQQQIQCIKSTKLGNITLEKQVCALKELPDYQAKLAAFWHDYIEQKMAEEDLLGSDFKPIFQQSECLVQYGYQEVAEHLSKAYILSTWTTWLLPHIADQINLKLLRSNHLLALFKQSIPWGIKQQIEQLFPSHIEIPSGRRVAIDYGYQPPRIAAKLQELFGATTDLSIMNGKLPLTIELLSPAGKPLQLTADLNSFWKNAYHEVKKEMKGRYPKHPWPDDPVTALASAKTKKQLNR
jgi:ATP-dependent helicase HrpB